MSSTQRTENRSICHGIIKQISHTFQRKRYVCTVLDSGSMLFFAAVPVFVGRALVEQMLLPHIQDSVLVGFLFLLHINRMRGGVIIIVSLLFERNIYNHKSRGKKVKK